MNKLVLVIFGIFLGVLLSRRFDPEQKLDPEAIAYRRVNSEKTSSLKSKNKLENVDVKKPELNGYTKQANTIQPKPKQKLEITITDELVKRLEKQWNDLPKQIRLASEKQGWRVQFIDAGSDFAQTGLQVGDFISFESIEKMKTTEEGGSQLSNRIVSLFNRVQ